MFLVITGPDTMVIADRNLPSLVVPGRGLVQYNGQLWVPEVAALQ